MQQAIALIKIFEGFASLAYRDPVSGGDPITIGYGTTRYRNGRSVTLGDTLTEQMAASYLQEECDRIIATLKRTIPRWEMLEQNQQAALVSFAYNLGSNFYGSEGFDTITRMLKSGDFRDAARIFGLYTNQGVAGLVTRRKKEAELFCKTEGMITTMPTKILDYVEQPDGYTCQSAAIAKVIGSTDVASVRSALLSMGVPGDPGVMAAYLKDRVKSYQFIVDGSLNEAKDLIKQGCVIITHGWFTSAGHVITLVGFEPSSNTLGYRFVVDDPWCEFDFASNRFDHLKTGNNVRYSSHGIYAYCVAGQSNDDAQAIYKQGRLLSSERNMWMHVIKN